MKISLIKRNIQTIITSLNKLQKYRDILAKNPKKTSLETAKINKYKQTLEEAFADIESESLDKIVAKLRKRKIYRKTKKLKAKKKDGKPSSSSSNSHELVACSSYVAEQQPLSAFQKRELRNAKKYIASIDCLETLHRLKNGGPSCKLKESLNPIKSIWESTEHTINAEVKNSSAKMWDKVLFGGKCEIESVSGLNEFLERRCVWDSYLDCSNGSHIPVGWVYPKEDARSEWKQFLQLT